MHTLRTSTSLLLLPLLCLAGCASTSGVSSKMKTVASVGDKKYPVVTGEPGSSVVADVVPTEPSVRSKGRISGRVVDETGEPLPDVRVRLAVGKTPGGQVISATTDRTGAFTLNGVRAGSAHTVIAEWEDDQEFLTGRSVVNAPDTNVRITLAPSGTESKTAMPRFDRTESVRSRKRGRVRKRKRRRRGGRCPSAVVPETEGER